MIEAVCLLCNIVDGKWWPYYLPTYLCETEMIEAVCLLCNIVDGKWWPYYLPTYLCDL
jgi:hypothetical protein